MDATLLMIDKKLKYEGPRPPHYIDFIALKYTQGGLSQKKLNTGGGGSRKI